MGHKPNQTLKGKLKRDTNQRKWDTYQGETKTGHLPYETSKLIMKCDKRQINGTQERQNGTQNKLYTKVETKKVTHYKKIGHKPIQTMKLKLKQDTKQKNYTLELKLTWDANQTR